MSDLKDILVRQIQLAGPMSLASYITECLMHPEFGYYQKERVFGTDGDFTTAPEISPMFGEMIALALFERWQAMGKPNTFNLIEFGPGRGTLMADILHTLKAQQAFMSAVSIHFIEASLQLRHQQKTTLENIGHTDAHWHTHLTEVPERPSLIIANEFFDALPIHQFEKTQDGWRERCVTVGENNTLTPALGDCSAAFSLTSQHLRESAKQGDILEVSPVSLGIMGDIAARLKQNDGAALIIDYGYSKSAFGDTFQALKAHHYTDPYNSPGSADLTAHVAFDQLKKAAEEKELICYGPQEQGAFLMQMGIGLRAQELAKNKTPEEQEAILSALKRLTAPNEMGELFKVLMVTDTNKSIPPGFH